MECKICGNKEGNIQHYAKELLYGTNEIFHYIECNHCGCVQISELPSDIKKHYPTNYHGNAFKESNNPIEKYLRNLRTKYALYKKGFLGKVLYNKFPQEAIYSLNSVNPQQDWKILDVGCGGGALLYFLREVGFKNLLGVDPYIDQSIAYRNGLEILKKSFYEINDTWDLIMFHHSFEHIYEQRETLRKVRELLAEKGMCIIRVPTVSSFAWKHYGLNWVQFDAPRHFFLHSVESFTLLANQEKLKIKEVIYDSSDLQFWGSEQNLQQIFFYAPNSYFLNKHSSIFTRKQIRHYKRRAIEMNFSGNGDQIIFIVKK